MEPGGGGEDQHLPDRRADGSDRKGRPVAAVLDEADREGGGGQHAVARGQAGIRAIAKATKAKATAVVASTSGYRTEMGS